MLAGTVHEETSTVETSIKQKLSTCSVQRTVNDFDSGLEVVKHCVHQWRQPTISELILIALIHRPVAGYLNGRIIASMQPKTNRVVVFSPADLGQCPRIKANQVTRPCFSIQYHTEQISRILGVASAIGNENRLRGRMGCCVTTPVLDCLRLEANLSDSIKEGGVSSVNDAIVVPCSFSSESRVDCWEFTRLESKNSLRGDNCSGR